MKLAHQGFTLIEVMVVMLIVGILATTISFSLAPDTHRVVQDESYRFARVLEQAVDQAETARPMALVWGTKGYGFEEQQDNGQWQLIEDDFFAPQTWSEGIEAEPALLNGKVPPEGTRLILWQEQQASHLQLPLKTETRHLLIELSPIGSVKIEDKP